MKIRKLLNILILTLVLCGCSRIKIAYEQLDWLLPLYLSSYIDLSVKQNIELENQVKYLLTWHCNQQLKRYANLLRAINSDFQTGNISQQSLQEFSQQIESYWLELMQQASPGIARLLLSSNEEQLAEFFKKLEEQNQEWLAEYNSQTSQELNLAYNDRMLEILEFWLGPLEENQLPLVKAWAKRFIAPGLEGLKGRRNWQDNLRGLSNRKKNVSAFDSGIKELFLRPKKFRTRLYQNRMDNNRAITILLLDGLAGKLTTVQKNHLAHEALSIAQEFDDLSCTNTSININASSPIK